MLKHHLKIYETYKEACKETKKDTSNRKLYYKCRYFFDRSSTRRQKCIVKL